MRRMMLVLAGGAAVAVITGAAVTLSTELVSAHANVRVEQVSLNRSTKGDRLTTVAIRSDRVQNQTVVVRGETPQASVKQTQAAPAPAVVVQQPKTQQDHKLLDGCEQSVSPLATTSSLRARCVS